MRKKKSNKSVIFAERLKSLMITRRLTQQRVADAAGVSRTAVIKWLRGGVPGADKLFKLAAANGVSVEWFHQGVSQEQMSSDRSDQPQMRGLLSFGGAEAEKEIVLDLINRELDRRGYCKDSLDITKTPDTLSRMRLEVPTWLELKKSIIRLTAKRGAKAALAAELGVSRQVLGNWLSDEKQGTPNADLTLKLLRLVWPPSNKK